MAVLSDEELIEQARDIADPVRHEALISELFERYYVYPKNDANRCTA